MNASKVSIFAASLAEQIRDTKIVGNFDDEKQIWISDNSSPMASIVQVQCPYPTFINTLTYVGTTPNTAQNDTQNDQSATQDYQTDQGTD